MAPLYRRNDTWSCSDLSSARVAQSADSFTLGRHAPRITRALKECASLLEPPREFAVPTMGTAAPQRHLSQEGVAESMAVLADLEGCGA